MSRIIKIDGVEYRLKDLELTFTRVGAHHNSTELAMIASDALRDAVCDLMMAHGSEGEAA